MKEKPKKKIRSKKKIPKRPKYNPDDEGLTKEQREIIEMLIFNA